MHVIFVMINIEWLFSLFLFIGYRLAMAGFWRDNKLQCSHLGNCAFTALSTFVLSISNYTDLMLERIIGLSF